MKRGSLLLAILVVGSACGKSTSNATSGSTGGGTTGSANAGSSGSTTGASFYDSGCTVGIPEGLYNQCTLDDQCGCPAICVADPKVAPGATICEQQCSSQADCATFPPGVCRGGVCQLDFCAIAAEGLAPGLFGEPCSLADAGDGMCTMESNTWENLYSETNNFVGYCIPSGALPLGARCSNFGDGGRCLRGLFCPEVPDAVCSKVCVPASVLPDSGVVSAKGYPVTIPDGGYGDGGPPDGGCLVGQSCLSIFGGYPTVGFCGKCASRGQSCNYDFDCCSESCSHTGGSCN